MFIIVSNVLCMAVLDLPTIGPSIPATIASFSVSFLPARKLSSKYIFVTSGFLSISSNSFLVNCPKLDNCPLYSLALIIADNGAPSISALSQPLALPHQLFHLRATQLPRRCLASSVNAICLFVAVEAPSNAFVLTPIPLANACLSIAALVITLMFSIERYFFVISKNLSMFSTSRSIPNFLANDDALSPAYILAASSAFINPPALSSFTSFDIFIASVSDKSM